MRRLLLATPLLAACSDLTVSGGAAGAKPEDTSAAYPVCSFVGGPSEVEPLESCASYEVRGFEPWVEWTGAQGRNVSATPTVADLNGDGIPEIIVNTTPPLGNYGDLWVYQGAGPNAVGDKLLWKTTGANLGFGASTAVADLDGDGDPEIVAVKTYGNPLPLLGKNTEFSVIVYDHLGAVVFETERYGRINLDYATAPIVADLDADGVPEIVAGRLIFRNDGTLRGKGIHGRGSYGILAGISEASVPAVADLDLDGKQEVIVGDAMYDADGNVLWHDPNGQDGMIAVANLDDDPEGEFVVSTYGTVRAHDTDGTKLWGPYQFLCEIPDCEDDSGQSGAAARGEIEANILSNAAIGDIDGDGRPEIVLAGGSQLYALNHDGTILWEHQVRDISGATGASIFDFEGDGIQEVVYIDEQTLYAFDGVTGDIKLETNKHGSRTMMDYPVIADVDGDGEAEIIVGHMEFGVGFSVYGQADGRWAPARKLWNQHAYSITNINDDFSVPTPAPQAFQTHNTWHAATDKSLYGDNAPRYDLRARIAEVCEVECGTGVARVTVEPMNLAPTLDAPQGIPVTVYVETDKGWVTVSTQETGEVLRRASVGAPLYYEVPAALAKQAIAMWVIIDDDGEGNGRIPECIEDDNAFSVPGPFCAQ